MRGESDAGGCLRHDFQYRAVLFAASAIAALFATTRLSDADLWFHLAGGRLIWEHGIPTVNTFSHAYPEYPWRYTQWLFGALLQGAERFGGFGAVGLVQILFVTAAFALCLDAGWRGAGCVPWLVWVPLLVLGLSASRFRFVPRPELVTFVGLALVLNLWERRAAWMPLWCGLIGIVWGNSHAGVIFGAVTIALIAASCAVRRDGADLRRAALSGLALVAGSLANPNFAYPYQYALEHVDIGQVLPLLEFRRAGLAANRTFFVFSVVAAAAALVRLRRSDPLPALLLIVFLPAAVRSVRLIPVCVLAVLPGTIRGLAEALRRPVVAARPALAWLAAVGFALAAAFSAVRDARLSRPFTEFGWGVDWKLVPSRAASFVEARGLRGRMYNDFDQGGYLAWRLFPAARVFVDGRVQAYPPEFFRELLASTNRQGWPAFMERYGIEYAIVQRRFFGSQIDVGILFEAMGWPLVHVDGVSYVYVKPGGFNEASTRGLGYHLIRSASTAEELFAQGREDPGRMLEDLRRLERERLLTANDFYRFGVAAVGAGDPALGERFFQEGIRRHPDHLVMRVNYGLLLFREGRKPDARRQMEEVLARGAGTDFAAKAVEVLGALGRAEPP